MSRPFAWLAAVILLALNLRPAIASVPPVVGQIQDDLGLSSGAAGVLTAIPVLCMGLFAPAAAAAAARWGVGRVLAAAVALIGLATAIRPFAGSALLFSGTVAAGIGIAVGSALLPALVRVRFPERIGPITGVYTTALIGGALFAAGGTEPLDALTGSWRTALAFWAVLAALALAVWVVVRPSATVDSPTGTVDWSPWRSGRAWQATLYMGGQSLLYYSTLAWLADRYIGLGRSEREAGVLLAIYSATQLISALGMPVLGRDHLRPWIGIALILTIAGLAMVAVAPLAAPALWAALMGLGAGGSFSLALTVVSKIAPTPDATPRASGMAFFIGYLMTSVGPVAVGLLHDGTGDYRWPFLALVGAGLLTLVAGLRAGSAVRAYPRPVPHR